MSLEKAETTTDALALAQAAQKILEDKQGRDIVVRDVRGLSGVTDYCMLVTGSSPPHLKAMLNALVHGLKQDGVACFRKAGTPESGWLVADYVDLVIHIFAPDQRQYYALEELWAKAPRLL